MDKGIQHVIGCIMYHCIVYIQLVIGNIRNTASNMDMYEKGLWYERFGAGESSSCDDTISEDKF